MSAKEKRKRASYSLRPRADGKTFDLISEALPFGKLWFADADAAIGYAKFFSRQHGCEIRVFNPAGELVKTHTKEGDSREPY